MNIFVVLKWSLSSFSSLQFPGDDSEEQVMCVAMLVCEWVLLILKLNLSQNYNRGQTSLFFLSNLNIEVLHMQL